MKTLYIVRHAKSSWDHPQLSDKDRPLSKRGERDAPKMGQRLYNRGISPDLILSSPANRAITTCKTIARALGYPLENIEIDDHLYHASEDLLLDIVNNTNDIWLSLMIFGHNPGFTDFANSLTDGDLDNIPTCGVFACTFEVGSWQEVGFGNGSLLFFDYPKKKIY
ncbi:histidine phosphatase family protein [Fulvivirga sp. 29W222]|uniref:Histidine phosphatase family protein n=1 Tax=Fulvivirga marina TaxID=2494733 RepID=A0A937FW43_9BACT|nr:histidine phosphatase family protein [Fulvivirga marina]MBL6445455.1 histidine phosphatase family protein [Fulvivirga marina]